MIQSSQMLPVRGIINARDLGGYTVGDGNMRIRRGLLIRSAHLARATERDIKYLEKLPLAKIIDFRKEEELPGNVDKTVPGAKYVSLPMDAGGKTSQSATEEERRQITGKKKFDLKRVIVIAAFNKKAQEVARNLYPTILTDPDCMAGMAAFLREVVDTESGAVLLHCTQGKDRTGVASALLLAALGAARSTIISDFDYTNTIYERDLRRCIRRVRFVGGKEAEIGVVKAFIGANTDNFVRSLDSIGQKYGSLEGYLKGPMGLSDQDLRALRERYLEPNKQ